MWKSVGRGPSLRVLPCGICLTTQEKTWKNLNQGKKTLSQVMKTSVKVQYTYYQNTHTLQNPHKHTHYKTHTNTHIKKPTHNTHTHRISPLYFSSSLKCR
jgi:hypothetical protein